MSTVVDEEGIFAEEDDGIRADGYRIPVPEIPPPTRDILENNSAPDETGIGGGLKKTLAAVRKADWPIIRLQRVVIAIGDELYAADAQKQSGEEVPKHRRGDLKTPAHVDTHWFLQAAAPTARVAFRATWMEGITEKGARSFKWRHALAADPVGMPTECFADYEPSANDLKQLKDEPAWAHRQRVVRAEALGKRRNATYNDRVAWLNRRPLFKAAGAFDAWLTEAISITQSATKVTERTP